MTPPRLAIDTRYAAAPLSGFGRFTWNLLKGLKEIGPPEPILLLQREGQSIPAFLNELAAFPRLTVERSPYPPLGQWHLARSLDRAGITVMASPDVFAPLCRKPKQVITLHDIIPLRCPDLLHRSAKGRFSGLWRQWLKLQTYFADGILTVSDHARGDIEAALPRTAGKLRTVYNAVPAVETAKPRRGPAPSGRTRLLYVGRTAPYKNIVGCIETLALLRNGGMDAELVIVGEPDSRYPEAGEAAKRLAVEDRVEVTGHVDEARLLALYRDADVFLFLSRYEGFGLPPLEAMAQGVPVVASHATSMPEVLGDAALLVDPEKPEAAATSVRQIVEQPDLAATLRQKGLARAANFTVQRQARMFWDAVHPLL